MPQRSSKTFFIPAMIGPILAAACLTREPDALTCVVVDAECAPLYEPTFDRVFARTLKPTCAKSGVSCHSAAGHQGGLAFEDADTSYRLLAQRGVVRVGDPACSGLVARVASSDPNLRMPPGLALSAAEQCALVRWIADGAKR
jgi:hypothetical protein